MLAQPVPPPLVAKSETVVVPPKLPVQKPDAVGPKAPCAACTAARSAQSSSPLRIQFRNWVCLISLAHSINNGGVTIDLIHRDSPLSPSHDPSQTRFQRLRNAIDRSFFRKSSLLLTLLKSTSKSLDKTTQAPVTNYGGEYLLEYKIGTPPVRQLSVADTGSDLLWIQCEPCTSCYKQDYPPFDPSASKSYRPVSCQSKQCSIVDNPGCGDSNTCQYKVGYGDRSYSQGEVAAETVTLGSAAFPNVVFGCGSNNAGTFRPSGSGILGLGNGEVSIINQKSSSIRGRFSYCLTLDSNATSKISFGNDAVVTGPNVLSTPLVSKDPPTFYYLTLEGLSVGKQRIVDCVRISNHISNNANRNFINISLSLQLLDVLPGGDFVLIMPSIGSFIFLGLFSLREVSSSSPRNLS
ncbi:hypothetical protein ACS0TY_022927 [Phlomoides rotata]